MRNEKRRCGKRFIGINYAVHDGGIAVYDEAGDLLFLSQYERLSRVKTDHAVGDVNAQLLAAGLTALSGDDHIFMVRPNTAGEFATRLAFEEKKDKGDLLLPLSLTYRKYNFYHVSHHLSHATASWMFRASDLQEECLYLVFDGQGFKTDLKSGFYSVGTLKSDGIKEIENNRLSAGRYSSSSRLDRLLFPGSRAGGTAGKLMGMAGHVANIREVPLESIDIDGLNRRFTSAGGTIDDALMADYAMVYTSYIADIKIQIAKYLDQYPHENVVVGGGTFLALELNSFLREKGKNVIFGPCVNDSGIAMGSAALGFFLINGIWPKALKTPFCQWAPPEQEVHSYVSPKEAATLLTEKSRPIGVVQGKGEIGPRALGHRSLLAVPSMENKILVSERIKKREFYRPVAPIVTARDFDRLFTGPKGKYMQYRNFGTPLAKELTPGVIHNDNSARAQVLEYEDNPWLYDVLVEVGKKSGAECLINTSLNGPGKPISNTVRDARNEMDTSLFDLLFVD